MTEEQHPHEGHAPTDLASKPHAEVAAIIAERLGETEESPRQQIASIVQAGGRTQALTLLDQTMQVEAAGGMMLPNGSRRRTPGGVFFHLAYTTGQTKSGHKLQSGMPRRARPKPAQSQALAPQPTPVSAFTWEDRIAAIEEMGNEKGRATTVKITLIGQPGKVIDRGACVVLSMQHTGEKFPALPKGVPAPQPVKTSYVVYIGKRQWQKVAEAISSNKDDVLIVEGFPQTDAKTNSIAVYATNVTTRLMQQEKRA